MHARGRRNPAPGINAEAKRQPNVRSAQPDNAPRRSERAIERTASRGRMAKELPARRLTRPQPQCLYQPAFVSTKTAAQRYRLRLMPRVRDSVRYAALACWLMLGAAAAAAESPVRQVLLLQSFDRGNLILDQFTGGLRVELDRRAGGPVNVVQVTVGPSGFVGAPEQAVVDFIRSTFADRPKPDLIVTIAGPAGVFARKYRQQLFPDTPVLFAAVDERYLQDPPLSANDTAKRSSTISPGSSTTSCNCCPRPVRCS